MTPICQRTDADLNTYDYNLADRQGAAQFEAILDSPEGHREYLVTRPAIGNKEPRAAA